MKQPSKKEIEKAAEEIAREFVDELIIEGCFDSPQAVKKLGDEFKKEAEKIQRERKIKIN